MEWAAIVKEFMEIGLLGLCGCVVIYAVLNNFKLKNQRIEKEAERVDNKENKDEDRFDKMLEAMQQQNKEYQEMMMGQFQMMSENIINGVINHVPSDEENAKITMDGKTGQILSGPDLISRGFVYVKESEDMLEGAKQAVEEAVNEALSNDADWSKI